MAVVLRSQSDLVYLPDHGFVGEQGALRILLQINRPIHRIDISHNLLGSTGLSTLLTGLNTLRGRYSDPTGYGGYMLEHGGIWGIKELNIGMNDLDDESFERLCLYAKKDVWLEKVLVQGNNIKLETNLESIVHNLNSSRIQTLSLTNNPLSPTTLSTFFTLLSSPNLTELHLSACSLPPSSATSIASFLKSPRSRNIDRLELNGNCLGLEGCREIIDSIEEYNFGIGFVALLANDSAPPAIEGEGEGEADGVGVGDGNGDISATRDTEPPGEVSIQKSRQKVLDKEKLDYQVHTRLREILERNRTLTRRIQRAAIRCLPTARILLHAKPPDDLSVAKDVIQRISSLNTTSPISPNHTSRGEAPFRILDLPEEVLHLIIRHSSGDSTAFSDNQFARLRTEAINRNSILKFKKMIDQKMKGQVTISGLLVAERGVQMDWLKKGRWDKWELDREVSGEEDDEVGELQSI